MVEHNILGPESQNQTNVTAQIMREVRNQI